MLTVLEALPIPAQFTNPWRAPNFSTVWSIAFLTLSSSVTFVLKVKTSPSISLGADSKFSSLRSNKTVLAPFVAKSLAVANPNP